MLATTLALDLAGLVEVLDTTVDVLLAADEMALVTVELAAEEAAALEAAEEADGVTASRLAVPPPMVE